uniref:Uncharacterized protein n=1 Tax=Avena sativa TaxID=4498 RepID=A0ACD5YZA7_AVESA
MAHRVMALSLVSGHNLKDVNVFSRMEVYALGSVCGDPRTLQKTKTDRDGARHPTWGSDDTFWFPVPPTADVAYGSGACLHVLLRTERLFSFGDRDVGEVYIPLAELLAGAATEWQRASYQVRKVQCAGAGHRGTLKVAYRFGPVMPPLVPDNAYQPPPWQFYPQPHAYPTRYQAGTKYIRKNSSFAQGLGAGLLGGGFGAMRFADMPSSDKSAYEDAGHGARPAIAGGITV